MNATRSRCARSMFAWILKTSAENSSPGAIIPLELSRPTGDGIMVQKVSRNASSPKLFIALPKNIGDTSPAKKRSSSNASPASSRSPASSTRRA